MGLRQRLENAEWLIGITARLIAGYLRLCRATTRWERRGLADLRAALAEGPVIVVFWHDVSMMAPAHWPPGCGPLTSLRDTSPAGRVSGAVQTRFGLLPMAMEASASNRVASRAVLKRVAEGVSIGLTGDGPKGPARVMKEATLDWARVTGCPLFLFGALPRRHLRLKSWDRLILPLPFTRGLSVFRRWDVALPRKAAPEILTGLRLRLAADIDRLAAEVAAEVMAPAQPPAAKR